MDCLGSTSLQKDCSCTCRYHLIVKRMKEIIRKQAVDEVSEKLDYLKARAVPLIP